MKQSASVLFALAIMSGVTLNTQATELDNKLAFESNIEMGFSIQKAQALQGVSELFKQAREEFQAQMLKSVTFVKADKTLSSQASLANGAERQLAD